MSKKPTPKKQQANSQTKRRYKAHENRARKKLEGVVDSMKRLAKNPRYAAIKKEIAGKSAVMYTQ